MTPEERRAFARGFTLARKQMQRRLTRMRLDFDCGLAELHANLADLENQIGDAAVDLGLDAMESSSEALH
jgi:hypothetical protein